MQKIRKCKDLVFHKIQLGKEKKFNWGEHSLRSPDTPVSFILLYVVSIFSNALQS